MNFSGFDDWIEIFKGGKQVDSRGAVHDGDLLIDRAVSLFNAADHEPPIVVGHPTDNAPAFGWISGVKKITKNGVSVLAAKASQVVPEFARLVETGVYKKRSASFYPDGRLRHVGFLGGMPPAVKGLADLKFHDDDSVYFNDLGADLCVRPPKKEEKMSLKEFFEDLNLFKKAAKEIIGKDPEPDPEPYPKPGRQFSEADLETEKKKAAEEAAKAERKKVELEFAEKQAQAAKSRAQDEMSAWCDQMVSKGKIAPAWLDMGLKSFCERLDPVDVVSFSETNKQSAMAWFKEFVEGLPKLINFGEIAKWDPKTQGSASDKLSALVKAAMAKDKSLGYSAAFSEVGAAHPEIVEEYYQELRGE